LTGSINIKAFQFESMPKLMLFAVDLAVVEKREKSLPV